MFTKIGLIAGLALASSTAAFAQDDKTGPNWNYVEAGYTVFNLKDFDLKFRGLKVKGSFALTDNFFTQIDYTTTKDNLGADANLDAFNINVGAKYAVSEAVDVYVLGGYSNFKGSEDNFSNSESGWNIGGGIKAMATSKLEVGAAVKYLRLGDDSNETEFGGNVTYLFTKNIGLGVNLSTTSDYTRYGANLRFSF